MNSGRCFFATIFFTDIWINLNLHLSIVIFDIQTQASINNSCFQIGVPGMMKATRITIFNKKTNFSFKSLKKKQPVVDYYLDP